MLFSICSAPHRVSLFGGGSDLPETIDNGVKGKIISFSIKERVTTIVKIHSRLFEEKYRLNYSQSELVSDLDEIKNNIARETLKYLKINEPIYLATISDIPESCGLSSSSAFSVSMIGSINLLRGKSISWEQVAYDSFVVENKLLKRRTGFQDSYSVSMGGINFWEFERGDNSEKYCIKNVPLNNNNFFIDFIKKNISLIWLGQRKEGSSFMDFELKKDKKSIEMSCKLALKQANISQKIYDYIFDSGPLDPSFIGDAMKESWEIKQENSDYQVPEKVDFIIKLLKEVGAYGWKLSGSGGGGFVLCILNSDQREWLMKNHSLSLFNPEIDFSGIITKGEF